MRSLGMALVSMALAAAGSVAVAAAPRPAPSPSAASSDVDPDERSPDVSPGPDRARPPSPPRVPLRQREGMIQLPGGTFTMGTSDAKAPPNERPPLTVTVAPFWIDRTEVTVAAFRDCVGRRRCEAPARTSQTCTYDLDDPALPVTCVAWRSADVYCRSVGKRLPLEAEWEFAARGSTSAPYPWGGTTTSCAFAVTLVQEVTAKSCSGPRPARVGSHPAGASVFGVLDLSGNAEEWTADWYVEDRASGVPPRMGASRVLRGGGWLSPPSLSRVTTRGWGSSVEAGPNVGFRCARTGSG